MYPPLLSNWLRLPRLLFLFSLVLPLVGISGCNNQCTSVPTVEASMPATVIRSGQTNTIDLRGFITADGTYQQAWDSLRQFLLTDVATSGGGASWVVSGPGFPEDEVLHWLAIQLAGSFQVGDIVQENAVPGQDLASAWGTAQAGAREFQVSAPNFITASGSGTLEVLGIAPLRLRVNLVASNDLGEEIRIQGDMAAKSGSDERCD